MTCQMKWKIQIAIFADDTTFISAWIIHETKMHEDIEAMQGWFQNNKVSKNIRKCKQRCWASIVFSRKTIM